MGTDEDASDNNGILSTVLLYVGKLESYMEKNVEELFSSNRQRKSSKKKLFFKNTTY